MHLDALIKRLAFVQKTFKGHFRASPKAHILVPGCLDLLGIYTVQRDGLFLAAAVDKNVLFAVRPRSDKKVILYFLNDELTLQFSLYRLRPQKRTTWGRQLLGIGWLLRSRGYTIRGLEGVIHSTIPSEHPAFWPAVEMGLLWTWNTLDELEIPKEALPDMCVEAEQAFLGKKRRERMPCYTAIAARRGHAIHLNCRDETYTLHPWPAHVRAVICETHARPVSVRSLCLKRRQEAAFALSLLRLGKPRVRSWQDLDEQTLWELREFLSPALFGIAHYYVTEIQRVKRAVQALEAGDAEILGHLFDESFQSQQEGYNVISPEMVAMWQAVHEAGAYGARFAEGCYGGSLVALVPSHDVTRFQKKVARQYRQQTGREASIRPVDISDGILIL